MERSHPAIIEPDEWDHVQSEYARRKRLGRSYSGKSVLSAKLVCADCGGLYGSKVRHSTDACRRVVWHCNRKFKDGQRCATPTLGTETTHAMVARAYNQLMGNLPKIISDCETMCKLHKDFSALDAEIARQTEESEVVAGLVKAAVQEDASTAQSQDEYMRKYKSIHQRYEAATAELDRLKAERDSRQRQNKDIALFIRTLKKQLMVLDRWDNTIWTVMVEKGIVHRDGRITFIFYNGTENTTGAE